MLIYHHLKTAVPNCELVITDHTATGRTLTTSDATEVLVIEANYLLSFLQSGPEK